MFLKNARGSAVAGNVVTSITTKDTQINQFLYGHILLTTNATVANRRVVIGVHDENDDISMESHAGMTVPASQSNQHHEMFQGIFRETTFVGGALQIPIPQDFYIPPGYTLKITVENGVAGDSYDYALMFKVDHVAPNETMID